MQLAFKSSTPKNVQKFYDALVSNDIKGPMLRHVISDVIEIEERSHSLSAKMWFRMQSKPGNTS